ncbi:MAG TPA: response regulator [Candidatus Sulfotelmatobacter sp.]|nr:response regulator [Candidatus Sulfotelmatobacter sp.]
MFLLSVEFPKGPLPQASRVVLVAEDEVVVRNIVCVMLHKEGYEVLSAADGKEALELTREYNGTIDLLLSDVNMPRMDGVSLAEHMIKERPGIRVLLMSGQTSSELRGKNIRLPFMRKPFVSSVFRNKVRDVLNGPPAQPEEV